MINKNLNFTVRIKIPRLTLIDEQIDQVFQRFTVVVDNRFGYATGLEKKKNLNSAGQQTLLNRLLPQAGEISLVPPGVLRK